MLGQVLGSLSALESLVVTLDETIGPTSSLVLATVALGRQVKKIMIRPIDAAEETLELIVAYLQRHPTLQAVEILDAMLEDELLNLVRALPSVKQLEEVRMNWDFGECTVEGAELLRDVLVMESIKSVQLTELGIVTEEASHIICAAIAASPMQRLVGSHWAFPEGEGSELAKAFTDSRLKSLFFQSELTSDFYSALGHGLKEATCADSMQCLRLGHISNDCLPALLASARHFKLRELSFSVMEDHWSDDVDDAIA